VGLCAGTREWQIAMMIACGIDWQLLSVLCLQRSRCPLIAGRTAGYARCQGIVNAQCSVTSIVDVRCFWTSIAPHEHGPLPEICTRVVTPFTLSYLLNRFPPRPALVHLIDQRCHRRGHIHLIASHQCTLRDQSALGLRKSMDLDKLGIAASADFFLYAYPSSASFG
jgi:hypothetical protein